MTDWLEIFNNPNFMPHGHCYLWRPDILWTHFLSDLAIGISYYCIPIAMGILLYKRKKRVPHPDIFGLFIAFIFLCGTTHFFAILVTWYPAYEYQGWLKAATAFISVLTLIALAPKLPRLINLPGVNEQYVKAQAELGELKRNQEQMQSLLATSTHREERILELKKEINELLKQQNQPSKYEV